MKMDTNNGDNDLTFKLYEPTPEDLLGLKEEPALEKYARDPILKTPLSFSQPYNHYRIIAGYKLTPEFELLKYPGRYTELNSFSDLGDYIGAPVFFPRLLAPRNMVDEGIIGGFTDGKRSSNSASILCASSGGTRELTINKFIKTEWLAVVAYKPDTASSSSSEPPHKKPRTESKLPCNAFEVVENSIRVCDPGNDKEITEPYGLLLKSVKNGVWKHSHTMEDGRVGQLMAFHQDLENDPVTEDWSVPQEEEGQEEESEENGEKLKKVKDSKNWTHVVDKGVPVDTGRIGVFDTKNYFDDSIFEEEGSPPKTGWEKNKFCFEYDTLWQSTIEDLNCDTPATIPYGVVSSSGYGDGCYTSFVKANRTNDGRLEIVAVKVVFL